MYDKVTIHKEEYERLKKEHELLAILRSHGIERWEHWDKAVKAMDAGSNG